MSHSGARGLVCALAIALATTTAAGPASAPASAPTLTDLLTLYDRGEYDAVLPSLNDLRGHKDGARVVLSPQRPFDAVYLELRDLAPWWIKTDEPATDRRRLVIAAFALELAYARRSVDWRFRYPLVVWACELLRERSKKSAAERWWYLASIAVMQESRDWAHVIGDSAKPSGSTRFFSSADQEESQQGHLLHAQTAFPGEPRFLLARVQFEESQSQLEDTFQGPQGINGEQTSPATIAMLQRVVARQTIDTPFGKIDPNSARRILDRIGKLPAVMDGYEALRPYPSLHGDIELRLGFLKLRLERWDSALEHLRRVPSLTTEPFLVGLSHHFSGWIFQQTGRTEEAIAEYRRALDVTPRARSASILLAAQLAQVGRQAEGYAVLDAALRASPAPQLPNVLFGPPMAAPPDPWLLYRRGDAALAPTFLAHMRAAVR